MFLGIDGGGTKTDALLITSEGKVVWKNSCGGTNPNGTSRPDLERRLTELMTGIPVSEVTSLFAGVAGCTSPKCAALYCDILAKLMPRSCDIRVEGDILNSYYAAGGISDGVCAIAGTGAVAMRVKAQRTWQVGGWGYLLDDAGGGFDIGRRVLAATLRAHDGRGSKTELTRLVEGKLGGKPWEMIQEIYEGGRSFIASFAPLAFYTGDDVAAAIAEGAARDISEMIRVAARGLEKRYRTVLCGGLWRSPLYARVAEMLGEDYLLLLPEVPPVCGCAIAAGAGDDALARLKEEYR